MKLVVNFLALFALILVLGCSGGENSTIEMDDDFKEYVEANPDLQDVGGAASAGPAKPEMTGLGGLQN